MAQIVQTICDFCQADDIQKEGTPIRFQDVVLDICDSHIATLTLFDLVRAVEVGDVFARSASGEAKVNESLRCPYDQSCNKGKPYTSAHRRDNHVAKRHNGA